MLVIRLSWRYRAENFCGSLISAILYSYDGAIQWTLSECSDWPHMDFRNCSNNFNIQGLQRNIEYFPVRGHIQRRGSRHFKKGISEEFELNFIQFACDFQSIFPERGRFHPMNWHIIAYAIDICGYLIKLRIHLIQWVRTKKYSNVSMFISLVNFRSVRKEYREINTGKKNVLLFIV